MRERPVNSNDHELILRYLRKQMTVEELAEFEVRLMSEPELIRETQREEALIAALHECQQALATTAKQPRILNIREWFMQPMTAAAAMVVLLVSIPMIGLQQQLASQQGADNIQIAANYYVEALRSDAPALTFAADFPMLLHVDAGPNGGDKEYSLSMSDLLSGELIYEAQNQRVGSEGYLSLLLREPVQGEFLISLEAEGAEQTFRVILR